MSHFDMMMQRPMANVIRAGLTTGWWALMMTAWTGDMSSTLLKWYNIVLKESNDYGW